MNIKERLGRFLITRVEHDRGWTKVSPEDVQEFEDICRTIRDAKWVRDEDDDPTLEISIVDRSYGRRPWVPTLPYCHYDQVMTPEMRRIYLSALDAAEGIIKQVRTTLEAH